MNEEKLEEAIHDIAEALVQIASALNTLVELAKREEEE